MSGQATHQPALQGLREIRRPHAANEVFEQLAASILKGEMRVGASLPSERLLSERFGVSRIIVRQALHRLADIGLVRVRQGGGTTVTDPEAASDVRAIELAYRLGCDGPEDARSLAERQLLHGHALIHIAARRGTPAQFRRLLSLIDSVESKEPSAEDYALLEERFWRTVAEIGGNRFYILDMNWWYGLPRRTRNSGQPAVPVRVAFLRHLAERLLHGKDAAKSYLDAMGPAFARLTSARGRRPR
jgi:GntR family transcriptional regulator, transcriptional repressor for pyruvate dehydrogenase complex